MRSVANYFEDCGSWKFSVFAYSLFAIIAFVGVGLNNFFPDLGIPGWKWLVVVAGFTSTIFGMTTVTRTHLSKKQKWVARLINFLVNFGAMVLGGGLGLLVFK